MTKISFIYAYPLDVGRRRLFKEKGLGYYPTPEEIKEIIDKWKGLWDEVNTKDRVMFVLETITKRIPTRALECFIFGGGLNSMSTPFLIPVIAYGGKMRSNENFIQTMIHELLHIFITTDTSEYWNMVREKYSNEDTLTQNHIIIYAMLQDVYKSLFEKDSPDFSRDNLPPGYSKAIHLVKQTGYEDIISEYHKLIN